jgi:hypothetical protein
VADTWHRFTCGTGVVVSDREKGRQAMLCGLGRRERYGADKCGPDQNLKLEIDFKLY